MRLRIVSAAAAALVLVACGEDTGKTCLVNADCGGGLTCAMGKCGPCDKDGGT